MPWDPWHLYSDANEILRAVKSLSGPWGDVHAFTHRDEYGRLLSRGAAALRSPEKDNIVVAAALLAKAVVLNQRTLPTSRVYSLRQLSTMSAGHPSKRLAALCEQWISSCSTESCSFQLLSQPLSS